MQNHETHNLETFQDVFTDYLTHFGIQVPESIQESLLEKFFRTGEILEPVCALQYGKYILLIPEKKIASPQTLLFFDIRKKRLNQIALDACRNNF